LFFIFDPFASLPIFICLTKNSDDKEKMRSANRAIIVAAILFIIFTLLGTNLLAVFGISIDAFRIAGGLVLILMATEIIFGFSLTRQGDTDVAWVIVATPILTGPGVIATSILLVSVVGVTITLIAGVIALAITWALLRNSVLIVKNAGPNVIEIFLQDHRSIDRGNGDRVHPCRCIHWLQLHQAILLPSLLTFSCEPAWQDILEPGCKHQRRSNARRNRRGTPSRCHRGRRRTHWLKGGVGGPKRRASVAPLSKVHPLRPPRSRPEDQRLPWPQQEPGRGQLGGPCL
jgi:multiple antibiotic resistance protein